MKFPSSNRISVTFQTEERWHPEIIHQAEELHAPSRSELTVYRRSARWNGLQTLVVVREPLSDCARSRRNLR